MKLIRYYRQSYFVLQLCICVLGASGALAQAGRAITVVTEPNSTVWIDGVRYGVTDTDGRLAVGSVSPGVRSIRIRAAGFADVTKSVPAATRGEIAIKLAKTTDEAELAFQAGDAAAALDRQKAIAEYERAAKLRAKYPEAYLALARMHAETGSIEKAFAAITKAKRLKPGYAEASAVEGRLLKDSGEEDKSVATFKRAITEGRGFQPEAYTGLGILYKDKAENFGGTGDFEQETASYGQAAKYLAVAVKQLGSAPDAVVVYQLLGLVYERQKKFPEAIAVYEEFLRKFPDVSEAGAVASFITQIKKQMAEQE